MIRFPHNRSLIAAAVATTLALILILVVGLTHERAEDHSNPSDGPRDTRHKSSQTSSTASTGKAPASGRARQDEENRQLSRKLKDTRAELERVRQEADFRGEVAQGLAGEADPAPETNDELASSMGDTRRRAIEFAMKWPDGIPAEGTPEREVYDAEKQAAARDMANTLKWLGDGRLGAIAADPQKLARFQSMQLSGALGLSDDELRAAETIIRRRYTEAFEQGLNSGAKPVGPSDEWNETRRTFSQEAAREIGDALPAEKQKLFKRVFGGDFLWSMSFGG